MKNTTGYIVAGVSALAALVGISSAIHKSGQLRGAQQEIRELREQIVRMEAYVPPPDDPTEFDYSAVDTNNIDSLQALLKLKDAAIAELASKTNRPPRQRKSMQERMAEMKEKDPEAYAEMIKQRAERQKAERYNLAERTANFMELDTSFMSPEELASHELLLEKMANIWTLTAQFEDAEQRPNRETMQELFTEIRETRPLMEQERTVIFKQVGVDMGYEPADAQEFADYMEEIIDSTSLHMPGGGRRGGGGGGRGR